MSVELELEYVIFVHGTFAGSDQESGQKWWQKGSEFAQALEQRLPETITCTGLSPVFHWSGANSYGERRKAAIRLLHYVSDLERKQKSYHVVAHSHGGGVVWDALVLSESPEIRKQFQVPDESRPTLQSLRSVTTVGTPYLDWREGRIAAISKYFAAIYMMIMVLLLVFGTVWIASTAFQSSERLLRELVWQLNIDFNFQFLAYMMTTMAGVLWLGVYSLLLSPLFLWWTATSLQEERDFESIAASHYGSRCMFLFSDNDEAIQSLSAALNIYAPLLAKLRGRYLSPFDSLAQAPVAKFRAVAKAATAPIRWIFRKWLAPQVDSLIWSVLRGNAYGADRDGASVVGVTATPPGLPFTADPLPQETTESLLSISSKGIYSALPQIRTGLGQLASASPGALTNSALSLDDTGNPFIVHTAYFSCSDIVDLVAAHIVHKQNQAVASTLTDHLTEYFERSVEQRNAASTSLESQLEERIRKVRRSAWARAVLTMLIIFIAVVSVIFGISATQ